MRLPKRRMTRRVAREAVLDDCATYARDRGLLVYALRHLPQASCILVKYGNVTRVYLIRKGRAMVGWRPAKGAPIDHEVLLVSSDPEKLGQALIKRIESDSLQNCRQKVA